MNVDSDKWVVASRIEVTNSSSMLTTSCSFVTRCSKCFLSSAFKSVALLVCDIFELRICLISFLSCLVKVVFSVCSKTLIGSDFSGLTIFRPNWGRVSSGITVEFSSDPNLEN